MIVYENIIDHNLLREHSLSHKEKTSFPEFSHSDCKRACSVSHIEIEHFHLPPEHASQLVHRPVGSVPKTAFASSVSRPFGSCDFIGDLRANAIVETTDKNAKLSSKFTVVANGERLPLTVLPVGKTRVNFLLTFTRSNS